ncbi:MAG: hypothetical protein ACK4V6_05340 [Microthrixaceae bacterium]
MSGAEATATSEVRHRVALVAATVVSLASGAAALVAGRSTWWFADDWNSFAMYADGSLLQPFNGHLSLLPAAVFRAMYGTVGMEHYLPYRVMAMVAIGCLLAVLGRHVTRSAGALAAVLVVAATVWSAAAASNLLFPFLLNFTLPLIALVQVWWSLERRDRRGDVTASIWLVVALCSSGLGLLVLAAVVVELLVERVPWRRWATMAPGPVLWALWYAANRDASPITTDPAKVGSYAARMLFGGLRSLAGDWAPGGVVVGVVLVALVAAAVRSGGWRQGRLWGALTVPAAFIALTSVTRVETVPAIPPDELRYAWTIGAALLLVGVAAGATLRADERVQRWRTGSGSTVVLGAAAVWIVAIVAGAFVLWGSMGDWSDMVSSSSPGIRSNLYAAEVVGPQRADRSHVLPLSFEPVTTGSYLDAVAAVGSPMAGTTADQLGGSSLLRSAADRQLVQQLPIVATPLDPTDQLDPLDPSSCTDVDPSAVAPGSELRLSLADGAVPSAVRIARLAADEDAIELGTVEPSGLSIIVPDDAEGAGPSLLPYRVLIGPGVRVVTCR